MRINKKKILVANHHLDKTGGTETYIYSLIEELLKREYYVEYFTFVRGEVSRRIEEDFSVSFMSLKKYDLILANHNTCVNYLFDRGFVIQTCHGIFPELEQPSPNADAYVAISQEVWDHLTVLGYQSKIILNGINLDRYISRQPLRKVLKYVLSLCHSNEANDLLRRACDRLGVTLLVQDKYKNPVWKIENAINQADLVVGVGRSAYEAMSCGRPVIIFDYRQYYPSYGDGYAKGILPKSILNNCSGRFSKRSFSSTDLFDELTKYRYEDGAYFRKFAETNLSISSAVDNYLQYFYATGYNIFQFGLARIKRVWANRKWKKKLNKEYLG